MSIRAWKPTKEQLRAAANRTIPDVIAPRLRVLFCGINPSLYSAAIGHHFGRPGNRFWPTLYESGFTPRLFSPFEDRLLLSLGYGITNLAARATATADQLTEDEVRIGGMLLCEKLRLHRPSVVAVLGVTSYRIAFARPKAVIGLQPELREGVPIWVLPNPSGLNAHYTLAGLAALFRSFRLEAEALAASIDE